MLHENNSEPIELERADNGEIKNKIKNEGKNELELESKSYQMPANLVAEEFGEVNVVSSHDLDWFWRVSSLVIIFQLLLF